ncbi:MAG TPA: hypothetical protein VLK27_05865 [Chthoniobacterales bacterium]|nr:hypothetical protein [Chthoniobacterales bacterium]
MNWRLLTIINAAIALITVSAVIFGLTRMRTPRPRNARRQTTTAQSGPEEAKFDDQTARNRIEALTDLSNARVDDLGSVPAAELTHLMGRATPEQLAALAFKFNDAPTDARTFGGMGVFFQAWTELDPKAALNGAFQLKDVTMRKLAATAVVNSTSPSGAPELIAALTEHPDKDLIAECKNTFLDPLIAGWSQLDPEAASKFMDQLGNTRSSLNSTARENIAYNWGTLDPSAALEWVHQQGDKEYVDSSALTDSVIRGWCAKDIGAASDYVVQHLSDDEVSRTTAASVAEAMFSHGPEDAINWIGRLPTGDARGAAEFRVAKTWAEKDPSSAAKWEGTLPEDEQESVAGAIARAWVDNNWSEASNWIRTLTGGAYDSAAQAAIDRVDTTPQEALSFGLQIKNDSTRSYEIQQVIRQWSLKEPQAAEGWVKRSSLSPEEQEQLLNIISEMHNTAAPEATAERVIIDR